MIEFDLFSNDIIELIPVLENEKNKIILDFKKAMYYLAMYGREKTINNATLMVNGEELADSMNNQLRKVRETKNTVEFSIYNPTQNATYAEFGTGLVGFIQPYIHPTLSWKYDVNNHYEFGWYYTKDNQRKWSKGIPSQPFYFMSGEELERESIEFIKSRIRG